MTRLTVLALALVALGGWADPDPPRFSGVDSSTVRGSVSGRVVVSARAAAPPPALSPYARRRYQPPQPPGVPGGPEDAFVYLEPLDGAPAPVPPAPAVITQRQRTIIPHVTAVQIGQVVEFPNEDDIFHNLFSLSAGNRFSLGRYAPGVTETNVFENPGVVHLFCDIHAEMAGVILVVSTAHVARVERGGGYRVEGVPAGRYRAIAWHPAAGADTAIVEVGAAAVEVDFELRGTR